MPPGRFFPGYESRFIVTDLNIATVTWAQGLWSNRRVALSLGQASVIEADVDPDSFVVNGLWTDDYARVAQSNRIVYWFRRSGVTDPESEDYAPWVPAAAGIIMAPEDEGDEDVSLTHIAAYDPRKLLEARPVMDEDGELPPGEGGLKFFGDTAGEIALTCLKNTIEHEGGVFIDAGPSWGGTASWGGEIEATNEVVFNADRGTSVADVWDQLEETGEIEIVLRPIYDPSRTITVDGDVYHFTHELSLYQLAGSVRRDAVFAWGRLMRNVSRIDRMHDATPGNFFNKVLYYAGAGGMPVPIDGPSVASGTQSDATIADFGVYWAQQFFPAQGSADPTNAAVLAMAQHAIQLVKQGKRTIAMTPIPDRSPIPLVDYEPGDRVPVYAPRKLRATTEGLLRIEAIPVTIGDQDAYERTDGLLVTPDWEEFVS